MVIAGGYLFLDNVMVTSNFGSLFGWGYGSFGLSLIPIFAGIAMLFFDGKSMWGRLLAGGGLVIICAGVLSRLTIYFRTISLFDVLLILTLLGGGIGFIARSLKERPSAAP
jgi:multisubunit Na+/H+ antiporter MnhF subunit